MSEINMQLVRAPLAPRQCRFCSGELAAIELYCHCPAFLRERGFLRLRLHRLRTGDRKRTPVKVAIRWSASAIGLAIPPSSKGQDDERA